MSRRRARRRRIARRSIATIRRVVARIRTVAIRTRTESTRASSVGRVVVRRDRPRTGFGDGEPVLGARVAGVDELAVEGEVDGGEEKAEDACDEEPGEL